MTDGNVSHGRAGWFPDLCNQKKNHFFFCLMYSSRAMEEVFKLCFPKRNANRMKSS